MSDHPDPTVRAWKKTQAKLRELEKPYPEAKNIDLSSPNPKKKVATKKKEKPSPPPRPMTHEERKAKIRRNTREHYQKELVGAEQDLENARAQLEVFQEDYKKKLSFKEYSQGVKNRKENVKKALEEVNRLRSGKPYMEAEPTKQDFDLKNEIKELDERLISTRQKYSEALEHQKRSGTNESYERAIKPLREQIDNLEQLIAHKRTFDKAPQQTKEEFDRRLAYLNRQSQVRMTMVSKMNIKEREIDRDV